ncbi:MAG: serine O-acetyltransferase [Sulfuricurvum sp.]|uniref:serine O-acetyltransferase n=1 Tax=Sulfuricurvum sp. TaxID=2025608 RepID=UPI00260F7F0E|nr:serine O-acetyltransferase [Sulfuricurvum sp.]MDD2370247.1 serine O-acetyltransferase [Sulfuricurvum sp.]MDD2949617.1 serine O-acetyltransferase [Sulfuricurvum sp.]MDD5118035.1 serine O-acetyltransferase [Sulfuricurvum sp.]
MGLFSDIAEDFSNVYKNDPAISSKIELFFNYPGVWAIFWYRIANRFYRKGFRSIARLIMGLNQIVTNIDIHPGATIGRRVFIDHGFGVVIGQTTVIEDDVLIYQGVTLGGVSLIAGKRHPTIKSGVVIGAGAKVLGNITIGANSKIGANSVVVREVPDNSTAIGIPAHVIQKGRDKDPFSHNKLPDINKEMFEYLLRRVAVLEHYMVQDNKEILEQDLQLENIYESFIKAMKH